MIKTISLENAKKLAELGVKRGSYFFHARCWYNGHPAQHGVFGPCHEDDLTAYEEKTPAYTVCELGEMLPSEISLNNTRFFLEVCKIDDRPTWGVDYRNHSRPQSLFREIKSGSMADAMALMLTWLIRQGHVKAGGTE
jgi:hypothetical protein